MNFIPVNLKAIEGRLNQRERCIALLSLKGSSTLWVNLNVELSSYPKYVLEGKRHSCHYVFQFMQVLILFSDEVKVCQVPHIKGLRSENVIDFIINKLDGEDYLPSNYVAYPPNKTWLWNVGMFIFDCYM